MHACKVSAAAHAAKQRRDADPLKITLHWSCIFVSSLVPLPAHCPAPQDASSAYLLGPLAPYLSAGLRSPDCGDPALLCDLPDLLCPRPGGNIALTTSSAAPTTTGGPIGRTSAVVGQAMLGGGGIDGSRAADGLRLSEQADEIPMAPRFRSVHHAPS